MQIDVKKQSKINIKTDKYNKLQKRLLQIYQIHITDINKLINFNYINTSTNETQIELTNDIIEQWKLYEQAKAHHGKHSKETWRQAQDLIYQYIILTSYQSLEDQGQIYAILDDILDPANSSKDWHSTVDFKIIKWWLHLIKIKLQIEMGKDLNTIFRLFESSEDILNLVHPGKLRPEMKYYTATLYSAIGFSYFKYGYHSKAPTILLKAVNTIEDIVASKADNNEEQEEHEEKLLQHFAEVAGTSKQKLYQHYTLLQIFLYKKMAKSLIINAQLAKAAEYIFQALSKITDYKDRKEAQEENFIKKLLNFEEKLQLKFISVQGMICESQLKNSSQLQQQQKQETNINTKTSSKGNSVQQQQIVNQLTNIKDQVMIDQHKKTSTAEPGIKQQLRNQIKQKMKIYDMPQTSLQTLINNKQNKQLIIENSNIRKQKNKQLFEASSQPTSPRSPISSAISQTPNQIEGSMTDRQQIKSSKNIKYQRNILKGRSISQQTMQMQNSVEESILNCLLNNKSKVNDKYQQKYQTQISQPQTTQQSIGNQLNQFIIHKNRRVYSLHTQCGTSNNDEIIHNRGLQTQNLKTAGKEDDAALDNILDDLKKSKFYKKINNKGSSQMGSRRRLSINSQFGISSSQQTCCDDKFSTYTNQPPKSLIKQISVKSLLHNQQCSEVQGVLNTQQQNQWYCERQDNQQQDMDDSMTKIYSSNFQRRNIHTARQRCQQKVEIYTLHQNQSFYIGNDQNQITPFTPSALLSTKNKEYQILKRPKANKVIFGNEEKNSIKGIANICKTKSQSYLYQQNQNNLKQNSPPKQSEYINNGGQTSNSSEVEETKSSGQNSNRVMNFIQRSPNIHNIINQILEKNKLENKQTQKPKKNYKQIDNLDFIFNIKSTPQVEQPWQQKQNNKSDQDRQKNLQLQSDKEQKTQENQCAAQLIYSKIDREYFQRTLRRQQDQLEKSKSVIDIEKISDDLQSSNLNNNNGKQVGSQIQLTLTVEQIQEMLKYQQFYDQLKIKQRKQYQENKFNKSFMSGYNQLEEIRLKRMKNTYKQQSKSIDIAEVGKLNIIVRGVLDDINQIQQKKKRLNYYQQLVLNPQKNHFLHKKARMLSDRVHSLIQIKRRIEKIFEQSSFLKISIHDIPFSQDDIEENQEYIEELDENNEVSDDDDDVEDINNIASLKHIHLNQQHGGDLKKSLWTLVQFKKKSRERRKLKKQQQQIQQQKLDALRLQRNSSISMEFIQHFGSGKVNSILVGKRMIEISKKLTWATEGILGKKMMPIYFSVNYGQSQLKSARICLTQIQKRQNKIPLLKNEMPSLLQIQKSCEKKNQDDGNIFFPTVSSNSSIKQSDNDLQVPSSVNETQEEVVLDIFDGQYHIQIPFLEQKLIKQWLGSPFGKSGNYYLVWPIVQFAFENFLLEKKILSTIVQCKDKQIDTIVFEQLASRQSNQTIITKFQQFYSQRVNQGQQILQKDDEHEKQLIINQLNQPVNSEITQILQTMQIFQRSVNQEFFNCLTLIDVECIMQLIQQIKVFAKYFLVQLRGICGYYLTYDEFFGHLSVQYLELKKIYRQIKKQKAINRFIELSTFSELTQDQYNNSNIFGLNLQQQQIIPNNIINSNDLRGQQDNQQVSNKQIQKKSRSTMILDSAININLISDKKLHSRRSIDGVSEANNIYQRERQEILKYIPRKLLDLIEQQYELLQLYNPLHSKSTKILFQQKLVVCNFIRKSFGNNYYIINLELMFLNQNMEQFQFILSGMNCLNLRQLHSVNFCLNDNELSWNCLITEDIEYFLIHGTFRKQFIKRILKFVRERVRIVLWENISQDQKEATIQNIIKVQKTKAKQNEVKIQIGSLEKELEKQDNQFLVFLDNEKKKRLNKLYNYQPHVLQDDDFSKFSITQMQKDTQLMNNQEKFEQIFEQVFLKAVEKGNEDFEKLTQRNNQIYIEKVVYEDEDQLWMQYNSKKKIKVIDQTEEIQQELIFQNQIQISNGNNEEQTKKKIIVGGGSEAQEQFGLQRRKAILITNQSDSFETILRLFKNNKVQQFLFLKKYAQYLNLEFLLIGPAEINIKVHDFVHQEQYSIVIQQSNQINRISNLLGLQFLEQYQVLQQSQKSKTYKIVMGFLLQRGQSFIEKKFTLVQDKSIQQLLIPKLIIQDIQSLLMHLVLATGDLQIYYKLTQSHLVKRVGNLGICLINLDIYSLKQASLNQYQPFIFQLEIMLYQKRTVSYKIFFSFQDLLYINRLIASQIFLEFSPQLCTKLINCFLKQIYFINNFTGKIPVILYKENKPFNRELHVNLWSLQEQINLYKLIISQVNTKKLQKDFQNSQAQNLYQKRISMLTKHNNRINLPQLNTTNIKNINVSKEVKRKNSAVNIDILYLKNKLFEEEILERWRSSFKSLRCIKNHFEKQQYDQKENIKVTSYLKEHINSRRIILRQVKVIDGQFVIFTVQRDFLQKGWIIQIYVPNNARIFEGRLSNEFYLQCQYEFLKENINNKLIFFFENHNLANFPNYKTFYERVYNFEQFFYKMNEKSGNNLLISKIISKQDNQMIVQRMKFLTQRNQPLKQINGNKTKSKSNQAKSPYKRLLNFLHDNILKLAIISNPYCVFERSPKMQQIWAIQKKCFFGKLTQTIDDFFKKNCMNEEYSYKNLFIERIIWQNFIEKMNFTVSIDANARKVQISLDKYNANINEILYSQYEKIDKTHEIFVTISIDFLPSVIKPNLIGNQNLVRRRQTVKHNKSKCKILSMLQQFVFKTIDCVTYYNTARFYYQVECISIHTGTIQEEKINVREVVNMYIADGLYKFLFNYQSSKLNYSELKMLPIFIVYKIKNTNLFNIVGSKYNNDHEAKNIRKVYTNDKFLQRKGIFLKMHHILQEEIGKQNIESQQLQQNDQQAQLEVKKEKLTFTGGNDPIMFTFKKILDPFKQILVEGQYFKYKQSFKFIITQLKQGISFVQYYEFHKMEQIIPFLQAFISNRMFKEMMFKAFIAFKQIFLQMIQDIIKQREEQNGTDISLESVKSLSDDD